MGNFEKLSVLVIVVIIVMILVVALYTWQDNPEDGKELAKKGEFAPVEDPWPSPPDLFEQDEQDDKDLAGQDPTPPVIEPSVTPVPEPVPPPIDVPPTPAPRAPTPGPDRSSEPAGGPWTYTIKGGDTLSQISERELGSWRRQDEVRALNPKVDPLKIRAGDTLKMPPRGSASRASSLRSDAGGSQGTARPLSRGKIQPGEWYVLQRGDRMSIIAKRAYGNIDRWPELWARNLSVVKDPDDVQEGTRIFIPK